MATFTTALPTTTRTPTAPIGTLHKEWPPKPLNPLESHTGGLTKVPPVFFRTGRPVWLGTRKVLNGTTYFQPIGGCGPHRWLCPGPRGGGEKPDPDGRCEIQPPRNIWKPHLGRSLWGVDSQRGTHCLLVELWAGIPSPLLFQLYSPYGNLDLQPTKADNWDVGWQQELIGGKAVVSITGFYRTTRNQIDFMSCTNEHPLCSPGTFGFYDNVLRTRAQGLELAASFKHGPLSVYTSYTYTDTENTSQESEHQGKTLARRPQNLAHLWFHYTWPLEITSGVALRYYGKSFSDPANNQPLDEHILVDLRFSWKIAPP